MRYRRLGRAGLLVSELCIGSNMFGGADHPVWRAFGGLDQQAANAVLGLAFDKGINFVDTADVYGNGESEQRIGQALIDLGCRRSDVVIMTKSGTRTARSPNTIGASRHHLLNSVELSLCRLQTDYIDLYLIHHFDPATPMEETLRALDDLIAAGKIRYIGCSNFAAWQLMKSFAVSERLSLARFEAIEAHWSIATREIEREVVPLAHDQDVGILVWGPLLSGLLTGKYGGDGTGAAQGRLRGGVPATLDKDKVFRIIDAMRPVAEAHEATIGQIALAWLLRRQAVTSVVFGSRTAEQCAQNIAAADIRLSGDELAQMDEVSALPLEYAHSLVAGTPMDRMRYA
jgi:aryl-alcohol dehydrogenase-like predicted oxidoreductase